MTQQHTPRAQSPEQRTTPSIAAAHKQYMSCLVQLIVRMILTVVALVLSFIYRRARLHSFMVEMDTARVKVLVE